MHYVLHHPKEEAVKSQRLPADTFVNIQPQSRTDNNGGEECLRVIDKPEPYQKALVTQR